MRFLLVGALTLTSLACAGAGETGPTPEAAVADPTFQRDRQLGEASFVLAGELRNVALSPDGTRVATTEIYQVPVVFDVATGKPAFQVDEKVGFTTALAWSPSGDWLAVGGDNGLWLIDGRDGHVVGGAGDTRGLLSIAWSPDGARYAGGTSVVGELYVADGATGEVTLRKELDDEPIGAIAWSGDGTTLFLAGAEAIRRFDLEKGKLVAPWKGHDDDSAALVAGPDGALWSGGWDNTLRSWDEKGRSETPMAPRSGWVTELHGDPASGLIFATTGSELGAWDGRSAEPTWTRTVGAVGGVSVAGPKIAVAEGQAIAFYDRATGEPLPAGSGHSGRIVSLAWTADGLASAGEDDKVLRWNPADGSSAATPVPGLQGLGGDGKTLLVLEGSALSVGQPGATKALDVAFAWDAAVTGSPDGTRVAAVLESGETHLYESGTGLDVLQLPVGAVKTSALAFSADHMKLATGDYDGRVLVIDALLGEVLATASVEGPVFGLAFDPSGTWLVITGDATNATVVRADSGAVVASMEEGMASDAAAWSPDGKTVALGRRDGAIALWSAQP